MLAIAFSKLGVFQSRSIEAPVKRDFYELIDIVSPTMESLKETNTGSGTVQHSLL